MSALAVVEQEYEYTSCCVCAVSFGSPVVRFRRSDGRDIWCPNGHIQSWRKTEKDRLRDELEEAKRLLEWQKAQTRTAEDNLIRERKAAKREANRIKKRIGNGVCPCCNRTFSDLAHHMETKHKDYKLEAQLG